MTLTLGKGWPFGKSTPFDITAIGPSSDESPIEKGITS